MEKFQEYVFIKDTLESYKSFCVENYFSWVKDYKLPNLELDLPCIKKQSKIQILQYNKSPIFMQLSDGAKLFFTIDQYKRIDGKPEVGKTIHYEMIRLPEDNSQQPSQIKYCKII